MAIEFKYVDDCLEIKKYGMPELSICSGNPATFSMLRPQFKEKIIFDDVNGVWTENQDFMRLCFDTLSTAKSEAVDLLITPEYSFPYEVIIEICSNEAYKPEYGKLWCICCQGIKVSLFKEYLKKIQDKEKIILIDDALATTTYRKFVNAMFYIFTDKEKNIFMIPQIKTEAMGDPMLKCEGVGLSIGNVIYKIGKTTVNQVSTIICADVFKYNSGDLNHHNIKTANEHLILLHPQLNRKPRHPDFSRMRNTVYATDHFKDMIYITSNWALDTELISSDGGGNTSFIGSPWSSIYIKDIDRQWFEKEEEIRVENDKYGLGFGYHLSNKLKIWYCYSDELMQKIHVKKPGTSVACVQLPKYEINARQLYCRNFDKWNVEENYSKVDNLSDIINICEDDACYCYPLNESKKNRDIFFSIVTGQTSNKEQLYINDLEIPLNIGTYIDNECEELRHKNAKNFKFLTAVLREKKLPSEFKYLNENHKYSLKDSLFNLVSNDGINGMVAIVSFVDDKNTARKSYGDFKKKLNEFRPSIYGYSEEDIEVFKTAMKKFDNKKICVFYQDDKMNLSWCPSTNEDIRQPDRIKNEASILR
jgi:hypothetical protein